MNSSGGQTGAVIDTFGIRSRAMLVALTFFVTACLAIVVRTAWGTTLQTWCGLLLAGAIYLVVLVVLVRLPGDPMSRGAAWGIAVSVLVAAAITLWALPQPPTTVMQTGPVTGASIIVLALVAVRGRVLIAWVANVMLTIEVGLWSLGAGHGFGGGAALTLANYAVMIMGSLFALMVRPMSAQIYALRAAQSRRAADEASADAAAMVRRNQVEVLDERARPLLQAIAAREEFTADEVARARRVEAGLRDGIRGRGLDTSDVREAVWRARGRGVTVLLLDDGMRAGERVHATPDIPAELESVLVDALDSVDDGRVTARILPPGRDVAATITVDTGTRHQRIEFERSGRRTTMELGGEDPPDTTRPARLHSRTGR